ncbi:MAG TPA: NUDIX hydrolase [Candidatus Saccharimonadales bacterium]|nr:NUDIX hydrolase [Candidatus Saccharimonadales bacterium]
MNHQNYYRVSVKGVVTDGQGRLLLSREDNGKWEMLGGGLDHGEDPIACLKREIAEETGLTVTYVSPSPKYFVACKRLDSEYYIANVIYEIKLNNLQFTPSDECEELRFFTPEEMKQVALFPNVEELRKLLEA